MGLVLWGLALLVGLWMVARAKTTVNDATAMRLLQLAVNAINSSENQTHPVIRFEHAVNAVSTIDIVRRVWAGNVDDLARRAMDNLDTARSVLRAQSPFF